MTVAELQRILDWTNEKLISGAEAPSVIPHYLKLRDLLAAIIPSLDEALPPLDELLDDGPPPGGHLRLVVSNDRPEEQEERPVPSRGLSWHDPKRSTQQVCRTPQKKGAQPLRVVGRQKRVFLARVPGGKPARADHIFG